MQRTPREKFFGAYKRWNIWVVCIPARLTWLLQPADTHCFALLKRILRRKYHDALLRSVSGEVGIRVIIEGIHAGIREVLQVRSWRDAFATNGWGQRQRCLRPRILRTFEWDALPVIPNTLPTFAELKLVFASNRNPPLAELFAAVRFAVRQQHRHPQPPLPPPLVEPDATRGVWLGRLRSSSTLHLESPAAVSGASASGAASSSTSAIPPCPPSAPPAVEIIPRRPLRLYPVGRPLRPAKRARLVAPASAK